jgi:hypothetical protein
MNLRKQDPPICSLHHRLKVKGWNKMYHANGTQKEAGVAMHKRDFKSRALNREKKSHHIVIKGSIQPE